MQSYLPSIPGTGMQANTQQGDEERVFGGEGTWNAIGKQRQCLQEIEVAKA